MPELPEVEVVRRGLAPRTVGRTVAEVELLDARIIRRQAGGADRLRAALAGTTLTALVRRGKFLWWRLADPDGADTGEALMGHLGMSGQLRVRASGEAPALAPAPASAGPASDPLRHRRLSLHLDDGTRIDLIDQRLFGGLWTSELVDAADGRTAALGSPDALLPAEAAHIGRDLLDPALDLPAAARALRARRAGIKSLLLNQQLVSGIGNIYADEALWAARVRYDTPGEVLSQRKALQLLREARTVMERALEVGGTSFDALYVNVDGRSGYFARSLSAYGREGEPCPRCGTPLRRVVSMNRSSHFCPRCQRRRTPAVAPSPVR
ncbi:bifunctional DNA-formamidopyrimidine glycosylase/DNA-(apurinic or apyrimidinic site) lyase [Brachybacterium saurashtrense]|uniref:Formamidopyrimidine-DNA glycosylase n=1 Tax=Brachybacterium saurashtrense TaxID=556288 RepID=A0A345YN18_9MICO|nr:bifunctional DNA-formamidopyrimidine glycosylase/DNA-(apurinic or apyrimidinic site) lyase [Brachybacterium saurashtrense]AXK45320.1 bifunctional DNA-formamidopyrimidine glycosylase/DNA-(apurinic or apyrimidinic site) lyase [Brachybacterium saurashtrense]RRR21923.1 bifunctional DNA-formamidopyrimidine glycosylase/DNA-(apurinic or apyrimidinic site) lyase [Brachybacterium saurashtrense]